MVFTNDLTTFILIAFIFALSALTFNAMMLLQAHYKHIINLYAQISITNKTLATTNETINILTETISSIQGRI